MTEPARRAPPWPELAIAALLFAVVALLIIPVPRVILDGLLALNIALAVLLLMTAALTPRPLSFASFPTILVITTLFRVALEVAATRLVLTTADAGAVIRAFGDSVVGQSLVVGVVLFAVITVVQLVVVARGAERVAEVAARFALDALPGKQLAIDAELRAGTIDGEGARARRGALERESQLYGAMDGAMRFVKGDAVAAIVIVCVNLVGGMIIGVGERGMTAGEAVRTYSLLSIGGGLVAQIPSLLVAVGAGLLVTRVASTGDRALGDDLGSQLGAHPRALGGAAVLLVGLGLAPGLPFVPFVGLGLAAGVAAVAAARHRAAPAPGLDEVAPPGAARGPRLTLHVPPQLYAALAVAPGAVHASLAAARAATTAATGVPVPPFHIVADADLSPAEVAVSIDGSAIAWVPLAEHGGATRDAPGPSEAAAVLRERLAPVLARCAAELLAVDSVAALVDRAAVASPILVREVVPRVIPLPLLAEVLRALVREELPIGELAPILEALALAPVPTGGYTAQSVPQLVEQIRGQLRRQITARWAPRGQLAVYTVDPMIEEAVRDAIDRAGTTSVLALEPAIAQDIVSAVKAALRDGTGVILTSGDIRRHLRGLLEAELPDVVILAAHELAPGTHVQTTARIEVGVG